MKKLTQLTFNLIYFIVLLTIVVDLHSSTCFAQSSSSASFYPQIVLPQGILRGRRMRTEDDKEFIGFLGIPYAKAPVGPLRLKHPEPHPGWSGLADAWTYKQPCPQWDRRGVDVGSEDCLYLNVYTPKIERKSFNDFSYPVMVFMGSGDYDTGDGSIYGPQKLMQKSIVLVTFNYRIGALGFMSTNDQNATGNYGLYDQLMALKWISKNIIIFSGDPNSVTLFGQKSGASSIFYHILSPLSKGLFHKAIMQSGSGLCDWALQRDPLKNAQSIGKQLKCPISSSDDLIDCVKTAPVVDILRSEKNLKLSSNFGASFFVPVVEENGFLPQDPWTMINSGTINRVPIIMGFNQHETAYLYPAIEAMQSQDDDKKFHEKLVNKFLDCCSPYQGKDREKVAPVVVFQYFNHLDPNNQTETALRFINMTTDSLYISCVDETLRNFAKAGLSAYLYMFSYKGENTMIEKKGNKAVIPFEIGATNGDELLYLFDMKIGLDKSENFRDKKVSQTMANLWTDFARFGYTPRIASAKYPKWDKFDADQASMLVISDYLTINLYPYQASAKFWHENLRNFSGLNLNKRSQLKQIIKPYRALAWAMIGISFMLLGVVAFLLAILFYQKKTSTFQANESNSSHLSTTSSAQVNSKSPWTCYFSQSSANHQHYSHQNPPTITSTMFGNSTRIINPAIFETLTSMPALDRCHIDEMLH